MHLTHILHHLVVIVHWHICWHVHWHIHMHTHLTVFSLVASYGRINHAKYHSDVCDDQGKYELGKSEALALPFDLRFCRSNLALKARCQEVV